MLNEELSDERAAAIRTAIRARYCEVASRPGGHFSYPTGLKGALRLGYRPEWLKGIPNGIIERFVGVGNPLALASPSRGERMLDVGCGSGLDTSIAARLLGREGGAVGVDLTPEMLVPARRGRASSRPGSPEFLAGSAEALPLADRSFDLVISNGVLNLAPDKDRAFAEIRRVLKPEGRLALADLLVIDEIAPEVLATTDAWST